MSTRRPSIAKKILSRTPIFLFLAVVLTTVGCGTKTFKRFSNLCDVVAKHTFGEGCEEEAGTCYLPSDDGKPLTKVELKALNSRGVIDRNISRRDMRDIILHFKKYVRRERITVKKHLERGSRYLPYIIEVFRKEGIPEDLAYIAFIESGYDPKAVSPTGACGIWQFNSSTGKYFGMTKNSWVDKRRDPYMSTRSAARYFKMLYKRFNDWHLVITAYNAGEARVAKALATTDTKTFFEMRRRHKMLKGREQLTEEKRQYLPKFIAICKIIRNLELLGFEPCRFSKEHKVVELKVKPGTDLKKFAACIGVSWEDFYSHNATYLQHKTPPGAHSSVYVPHHKSHKAKAVLASGRHLPFNRIGRLKGKKVKSASAVDKKKSFVQKEKTSLPLVFGSRGSFPTESKNQSHVVGKGETLYSISRKYNVSQETIILENGLTDLKIKLGQRLRIPKR